jgi:hypothetical protein
MSIRVTPKLLSVLLVSSLLLAATPPARAAESPPGEPAASLEKALEGLRAGQRAEAYQLIEQAAETIWNQMGLRVDSAVLTREEAVGYGIYNPREDNVYTRDQTVLAYVEPQGYKVSTPLPGIYVFGVVVDVTILRPDGEVVWAKENFFEKTVESRRFNRDFFLNATLEITGAPPGEYVLKLTLHDKLGGGPAEATLPIVIK